ncbi:hypothetical protein [Paenilisteria rocourtiae]|uniref:Uncharacterized protein n=1 Tax=Listeria rocourtiae TaxID=647910 RepID=A0A4R6ZNZ2_9LIST|nr:hypothetical protein [Listeria rocourtiae]EUJ42554.1 hypothetical protein PROCOU_16914 [Listeria rocourtiae FSL F6-920]TDR53924.1 hypothetical protein DFP96_10318 [Listeria rocourtiae]
MVVVGTGALSMLEDGGQGASGNDSKFSKFASGTTFLVKALAPDKIATFDSFGVYKDATIDGESFRRANSFEPEVPSTKNDKGYAVDNLTPWDLASKYYMDQAQPLLNDGADKKEEPVKSLLAKAGVFRAKQRFILPFVDLDTGALIYIDMSKLQAQAVLTVTKKQHAKGKLNRLAFELEKSGSGKDTVVAMTPIIDIEDELTDKQQLNFAKVDIDTLEPNFNGLTFVADYNQQVDNLVAAGFDISRIGLEVAEKDATEAF